MFRQYPVPTGLVPFVFRGLLDIGWLLHMLSEAGKNQGNLEPEYQTTGTKVMNIHERHRRIKMQFSYLHFEPVPVFAT